MTQKKLRWGILGAANIARKSVIPGLQQSELNEVVAIASRTLDKAEEAAALLNIKTAHGSYEALLADETIDAVYVPLPNHLHKEWTIKAAQAGKHILCEKPFAISAADAQEMVQAAKEAGVHVAEAFMYRHHPRYKQVLEVIRSGEIGELRGLHGTFTFNSAGASENVRFRKAWGGGGLYDVGVYPITAARLLLGAEPEAVSVRALFSPAHDNVDMMASGLLEFPGGIAATFDCGMWAAFRNTVEVLGTEGTITLPSAFICGPDSEAGFYVQRGGERRKVEVPAVNHYALQGDDFARTALLGESPLFAPEDAVQNMRILNACLQAAENRTRITL